MKEILKAAVVGFCEGVRNSPDPAFQARSSLKKDIERNRAENERLARIEAASTATALTGKAGRL